MPNDPSISLQIRDTHPLIRGGVPEAHDVGDTGAVADAVGKDDAEDHVEHLVVGTRTG
jgi:hypothetical protein